MNQLKPVLSIFPEQKCLSALSRALMLREIT